MAFDNLRDRLRNDRGAVSVFVATGMVTLIGAGALAIDLGHVLHVRTESQRVADLAALAGASGYIDAAGSPSMQNTIEQRAIQFAARNTVNGVPVSIRDTDIQLDIPNERVRIIVSNTVARQNPVQTVFARVFGIQTVDVVTVAVAEAYPAGGANCILPFMLPDRHLDGGGNPYIYDDPADYYEAYDATANPPSATATGYTDADIGTQIIIKPGNQSQILQQNESWSYPLVIYSTGGAAYRAAIQGCIDPTATFAIGDNVDVEPGQMIGPTRQGILALIAQAPNHIWSPFHNCVIDTSPGSPANVCVASPRLRPVPMMGPPDAPESGRKSVPITNWAGVFIEGMAGNDVIARFAGYSGFSPGGSGGGSGSIAKVIRLVG